MLGLVVTLLVCAGWTGIGQWLLTKLTEGFDPCAKLGLSGLCGLGSLGLLTFLIGLAPSGFSFGVYIVLGLAFVGLVGLVRTRQTIQKPKLPDGPWLLAPLTIVITTILSIIGVLAPSDSNDWDTLAYHLAVPKLWIQHGAMTYIPFIHQSNFPADVDGLYVWGLTWGGEAGAKAFQLAFFLLGVLAIFGLARQRYGEKAGWWAAVAFATVPSILWEAGTAYIDTAHGLFAGLGILFGAWLIDSCERRYLWLAALMLGFGAASKYTGLQTILAVAAVFVVAGLVMRKPLVGIKRACVIGIVGVAMAAPWLARNFVDVRNPVYPFFYSVFHGENWDQKHADVYQNEQLSFGVGRLDKGRDPSAIGHAILGLAYEPGRYVNPAEDSGGGSPLGALGVVVIGAWLAWMFSGRMSKFEGAVVGAVIVSALMWFELSQQSRYIITWAVPLLILAGGATQKLRIGIGIAAVSVVQAAVSLFLMLNLRTNFQSKVVFGDESPEQYQTQTIPFYEAAQAINKLKVPKVALYDEVFGYLLDVPYFWANPPHSTVISYDGMQTGDDFVKGLKQLGFSHIYVNVIATDKNVRDPWLATMGLSSGSPPLTEQQSQNLMKDWQQKWKMLLAEAVAQGAVRPVQSFRGGILFQIAD